MSAVGHVHVDAKNQSKEEAIFKLVMTLLPIPLIGRYGESENNNFSIISTKVSSLKLKTTEFRPMDLKIA